MIEIIRNTVNTISCICVCLILFTSIAIFCYIYYLFAGKKKGKTLEECSSKLFSKSQIIMITIVMFVIAIMRIVYSIFPIGTTQIDDLFERNEYKEKYYVYVTYDTYLYDIEIEESYKLFSESYKTIANIRKKSYNWFDNETYYYINILYLQNENEVELYERVYPNEKISITIDDDIDDIHYYTYYDITLTTEKYKENDTIDDTIILNTNSKKYHTYNCSAAQKMSKANRKEIDANDLYRYTNYKLCGICAKME